MKLFNDGVWKYFLSECGNFKAVNYGGVVRCYRKAWFRNYATKKDYIAFGNSFVFNEFGKNEFKTYRRAFKAIQNYINN